MRYKLIIFDLDGTLVDAYKAIEESFNYTMRKLGYPIKDSLTIKRAVGWGDENLLKPFVTDKDLKKALDIYRRNHKKTLIKFSYLYPKVIEVLRALKDKGIKLAIASNRPTIFTEIILKKLKIDKYFDFVLCADKIKSIKPNPEILEKIMERLSVSPKDTIYVGDMNIDILAGKNAKVKTIAVLGGSAERKELKRLKPYKIISEISKILKIIET